MFWRDREKENKELNGGPPYGQIRVLIVGDSARPPQTIGCSVGVKVRPYSLSSLVSQSVEPHFLFFLSPPKQHTTYGSSGSSSNSIKGDSERDFFIELWDISGHERYKDCRSLFYSQINGVIFIHDLSQRRTKTSLQKWASEIAAMGTFSAPLASGGPGGLPVPYIVIGNKADIAAKEGRRSSSGNLVDVARQWVEKQGLISSSEELPLTETFPSSGGLLARNLTPPPTLYPQQPMSTPDLYNIPRFARADTQDITSARLKRTDINEYLASIENLDMNFNLILTLYE
ncbi:hypothetical protein Leryth_025989 [Lithospermum erythrorhizon]|nr:hypothetical protein Leryth_025989 [Lithospermum erythrorhizon]